MKGELAKPSSKGVGDINFILSNLNLSTMPCPPEEDSVKRWVNYSFNLSLIYIPNSCPFNKGMNLNSERGNSLNSQEVLPQLVVTFLFWTSCLIIKIIRQTVLEFLCCNNNGSCLCPRFQRKNYYIFGVSQEIKVSFLFVLRSQTTHKFLLMEEFPVGTTLFSYLTELRRQTMQLEGTLKQEISTDFWGQKRGYGLRSRIQLIQTRLSNRDPIVLQNVEHWGPGRSLPGKWTHWCVQRVTCHDSSGVLGSSIYSCTSRLGSNVALHLVGSCLQPCSKNVTGIVLSWDL